MMMSQPFHRLGCLALTAVLGLGFVGCDDKGDEVGPQPPVDEIRPIEERPLEQWNFIDAEGRVLIPRGVNYTNVSKGPTGLPAEIGDVEVDAKHIADLGFNTVRYLIQWKNIEPKPGEYDEAYFDEVRKRLDLMHAEGLHIILDMHQDVYGPKYGYNGAPDWAAIDDGIVFTPQDQWFANYLQPAVQRAFDNFFNYEKHGELQDRFAAMWAVTAKALGDHPSVIAFDLMNEPHPGSYFDLTAFGSDKANGRSAYFDRERLAPFYQRVINAIREVNNDAWILYEPRYGAPGDGGRNYLTPLNDPRKGLSRLFHAPHLYVFATEASHVYDSLAEKRVQKWEVERANERDRDVAGSFLGEFGTFTSVVGYQNYMESVVAVTENLRIGFAAWAWDPFEFGMIGHRDEVTRRHADGPFLDIISRPYPRAFAGTPLAFGFDPRTQVLEASWAVDHAIEAPTEFFLARARWYKNDWSISVEPAGAAEVVVDPARELVHVTVTDKSVEEITVRFAPVPVDCDDASNAENPECALDCDDVANADHADCAVDCDDAANADHADCAVDCDDVANADHADCAVNCEDEANAEHPDCIQE